MNSSLSGPSSLPNIRPRSSVSTNRRVTPSARDGADERFRCREELGIVDITGCVRQRLPGAAAGEILSIHLFDQDRQLTRHLDDLVVRFQQNVRFRRPGADDIRLLRRGLVEGEATEMNAIIKSCKSRMTLPFLF